MTKIFTIIQTVLYPLWWLFFPLFLFSGVIAEWLINKIRLFGYYWIFKVFLEYGLFHQENEIKPNANEIENSVQNRLVDVLLSLYLIVNRCNRSLAFTEKNLKQSQKVKKKPLSLQYYSLSHSDNEQINAHIHARYIGKWMESRWVCCSNTNIQTKRKKQRAHKHTHTIINYILIWLNCAHVCSHHLYVTYKII